MKFQIVLAAIFAFVAVSTKKQCGFRAPAQAQNVNLNNCASSDGNALACNNACYYGNANAFVNSAAQNANCIYQNQGGYC